LGILLCSSSEESGKSKGGDCDRVPDIDSKMDVSQGPRIHFWVYGSVPVYSNGAQSTVEDGLRRCRRLASGGPIGNKVASHPIRTEKKMANAIAFGNDCKQIQRDIPGRFQLLAFELGMRIRNGFGKTHIIGGDRPQDPS
jgi:hypothetical protein